VLCRAVLTPRPPPLIPAVQELDASAVDVAAAHVLLSMLRSNSSGVPTPRLSPSPSTESFGGPARACSQEGSAESATCSVGAPLPPLFMPPLFRPPLPSSAASAPPAMDALPHSACTPPAGATAAAPAPAMAAAYCRGAGGLGAVTTGGFVPAPRSGSWRAASGGGVAPPDHPPTPALLSIEGRPGAAMGGPSQRPAQSERPGTGMHIVLSSAHSATLRTAQAALAPVFIAPAPERMLRGASGAALNSFSFFSRAILREAMRTSTLPAPL